MREEVLIIGGGFAGLSTAYHLALKGVKGVVILERERKIGAHASGKNAGMIRQAIPDPALARMAHEGRERLAGLKGPGWKGVSLKKRGSMLLAARRDFSKLAVIEKTMREAGVEIKRFSPEEAGRRVSVLRSGSFDCALFCPSDGFMDIEALLGGFTGELKRLGVKLAFGQAVHRIVRKGGAYEVSCAARKWRAPVLVNAGGAWAGLIGQRAGAAGISLAAYKRHIFISGPFSPVRETWPFVWDITDNFYFRPWGRGLLLSPCDQTRCQAAFLRRVLSASTSPNIARFPSDIWQGLRPPPPAGDRQSFKMGVNGVVDWEMKDLLVQKLRGFSAHFDSLRVQRGMAALRTFAPDERFVIGEDPKLKGFFWVAGLGGHGVTTCLSVGRLAGDLIVGSGKAGVMERFFSPARF